MKTFVFLVVIVLFSLMISTKALSLISQLGQDVVNHQQVIQLKHVATKCSLHSHNLRYKSGSFRQEVTCNDKPDDNDIWIITRKEGTGPINHGDSVNLIHKATGFYLNSQPKVMSPTSFQQEVACYWTRDVNDNWRVETANGGYLTTGKDQKFRLIHVSTNVALHSNKGIYTKVSGQQEVIGYKYRDDNDYWSIEANESMTLLKKSAQVFKSTTQQTQTVSSTDKLKRGYLI